MDATLHALHNYYITNIQSGRTALFCLCVYTHTRMRACECCEKANTTAYSQQNRDSNASVATQTVPWVS